MVILLICSQNIESIKSSIFYFISFYIKFFTYYLLIKFLLNAFFPFNFISFKYSSNLISLYKKPVFIPNSYLFIYIIFFTQNVYLFIINILLLLLELFTIISSFESDKYIGNLSLNLFLYILLIFTLSSLLHIWILSLYVWFVKPQQNKNQSSVNM